ncbi:MAG TPA: transglycosylase SLT domain-containing protein [Ktedonobacteraceae bacterium]|nr:transglycosylase SLT domain-containing protein [Ktedonobacteraceae bacterium]
MRQPAMVEVAEESYKIAVPTTPPPITSPLFTTEQAEFPRTTSQLAFTEPPEVNTDSLEDAAPVSGTAGSGRVTRDLRVGNVTRDLQGPGVTRALSNRTTPLTGTLAGAAPVRPSVVIPGKKKRARKGESRRMSPYLRYSLIVGAMLGLIGIALVSLSPLNDSQQGQLPVLGGVARWIQIQQIAWNVNSHVSDQQTTGETITPPNPGVPVLPTSQYIAIAQQAATNAGISPVYFVNQINAESSFNPNAISPVGAVGIAQFLPSTAAGLGINPYDPVQALYGAANHMAALSKSYNGDYAKALAAYNAGSGAVNYAIQRGGASWLSLMPYETQQYIYKIMGS